MNQRALSLLSMLAIQFVLGMIVNLLANAPVHHPGSSHGNYFTRSGHSFAWAISFGGGVALFLHVLVAIGLLANSIVLVVLAARAGHRSWLVISVIGLLGILVAFSNGLAFLDFNKNASSFVMAMGFIVAVVAYTTGLAGPAAPVASAGKNSGT